MNVSLHFKNFVKLLIPPLILLVGVIQLNAQVSFYSFQKITEDTIDVLDFEHYHVVYKPQINQQASNGTAFLINQNGNPSNFGIAGTPADNFLKYTPNPGFYGYDHFTVLYYVRNNDNGYGSHLESISIQILVLPSITVAENDYATTTVGQTVEIDVLANDFSSGTNLTISSLPHTTYGTASVNGDPYVLVFTPEPGFSGVAHLNYTVCDDQGSCDMATVSVCVVEGTPPVYDSLFITTTKNNARIVLLPLDGYSVILPPSHGQLDYVDGLEYVPDTDYIGFDKVIFENAAGTNVKILDIHILDADEPNVFVKDDIAHTTIDLEVEIDVLENDLGGNNLYSVGINQSPLNGTLNQLSQGVYNYVPNAGFEGVDKFIYKASSTPSVGNNEYGTVYVVVSNQTPSLPVFELTTPKNTPLVIDYKIPITDYLFTNINQGNLGNAEYHDGQQTITSTYGQQFSGYNMMVYTPSQDVTGVDEFEFSYCVGGNTSNCPEVKVIVNIVDIIAPVSPFCAGNECVWTGDANHDGLVDVRDILPIGLCMGEVGEVRPNASLEWYGQYSDNWNSYLAQMGFDVKHIDTDGDGFVASIDTAAVGEFYGNYNNLTPQSVGSLSNLPFFIEDPDLTGIEPGDVITTNIWLGTAEIPAYDAYGLAFQLLYDQLIFDEVNVSFNEISWMSYDSPILSMVKKPETGKVDAGYTRTSGVSGNGYGVIGTVEFIVTDDLILIRPEGSNPNEPSTLQTSISFNPMGLMNGSGTMSNQNGNDISFTIKLPGERSSEDEIESEENTNISDKLNVYPNPANDVVNVHLNGYENLIERIAIYTTTGQEVYNSGSVEVKRTQINISNIEEGMYIMKVWSNGDFMNQKIEIIR